MPWQITFDGLLLILFGLSAILVVLSIYWFRLSRVTPIAREKIIDAMIEIVIVVDNQLKVADLNPAARKTLGTEKSRALGAPAADVLTKWPALLPLLTGPFERSTIARTIQDQQGRSYSLRISQVYDRSKRAAGWLILMQDITEQKQRDDEIRRLVSIIEAANESIVLTDTEGKILYANPYFETVTGYSRSEALGKNPNLLKSGVQDETFYQKLWQMIAVGQPWQGRFVNRRKDGSLYHEAATIFPIKDEFGKITHYGAVKRDITAQVAAEQDLRNLSEKLGKLHEINLQLSSCDSLDEMNRQAVMAARQELDFDRIGIWYVNPEKPNWLQGSFGIDEKNELRDERGQEMKDDAPIFLDLLNNEQRVHYNPDTELLDHRGQVVGQGEMAAAAIWDRSQVIGFVVVDNLLSRKPISPNQREVLHLFGQILGNLTSQKRARQALQRSERQYRLLADNVTDVIWTMDSNGRFTYISPSVQQLLGYAPEEFMQQTIDQILTTETAKAILPELETLLANLKTKRDFEEFPVYEFEQIHKSGDHLWTETRISIIQDGEGRALGLMGVTRDMGERKISEQSLQAYARQQRLLNEITQAAIEQNDFETMLQTLADRLGELLEADGCYITIWDDERQTPIPKAAYGPIRDIYPNLPLVQPGENTLTQSALSHGDVLVIEDIHHSPYLSPQIASRFPTQSGLALPLIANQQKLGAALIAFDTARQFSQAEIEFGRQAARQVALAILKVKLLDEARQRAREAETLRQTSAAIVASLEQQTAIERILEELNRVVPYDSASVLLIRDREMEIVGARGFAESDQILNLRFTITKDTPNKVIFETHKPYIIPDAPKEYAAFRQPPHDHIRGWMGIPLLIKNDLIGMLALDSKTPGQFTKDHARVASAFADQVAIALENARLFEETQRLATIDSLTGIYNRRYFMKLARSEFERSRRYNKNLSIIMFDVDHFKQTNDTYGHLVGDHVLQTIATICQKNLRTIDIIGRYGGEEFIILLPETRLFDSQKPSSDYIEHHPAYIVAERLRQTIAQTPLKTETTHFHTTISLGLAEFTAHHNHIETIINNADQALLQAKSQGRNRSVIYALSQKYA